MTFSKQYPHSTHKQDMMSEAEHWWNHLTLAQREFCTDKWWTLATMTKQSTIINWSYTNKEQLHQTDGWPETPMRSV